MAPTIWKCFPVPVWELLSMPKVFCGNVLSLSLPNLDALLYFIGISRNEVNALVMQERVK